MKRKNSVIARSHVHGAVLGTLDERRFFVRPDAAAAAARFVEQNSRDGGDGGSSLERPLLLVFLLFLRLLLLERQLLLVLAFRFIAFHTNPSMTSRTHSTNF